MRSRNSSIRMQIIVEFFLLILVSIGAFMMFSMNYTRDSLEDNSKKSSEELVEQVNFNIENYVGYMKNISQVVMGSPDIEQYLFGEGEAVREQAKERLEMEFQSVLRIRKDISNIALLWKGGHHFVNSSKEEWNPYARLDEKAWFQKAKECGEQAYISSSHVQNMIKGRYDWVVTMSHGLANPHTGEVEGMLLIDLNYNVINDLCEAVRLGERGYVYIVDSDGDIVYHPQQQLILSKVKEEQLEEIIGKEDSIAYTDERGEEKIYTPLRSEQTGWTIVGVAYASELVENESAVKMIYFGIGCLLAVLAVGMAVVVAENITRPMKQLQEAMDRVTEGDFEAVQGIEVQGENEVYKLQQNFIRMIRQIEELMQKNIYEEEEKRKSEMKALQSQINPHFLYNTLDSIIWMIEAGEADRAIQMTSALARFFRQAIGKSEVFVPLREELEYTKNYLVIQKMRYEDKVDYTIQVEEGLMECRVLKLMLQPLVENALYHGLKYKESRGVIQIIGYQMGEKMVLKVSDNGVGMAEDVLRHIFDRKDRERKHNGIGMGNIRKRMQLYYGESCTFQVDSEKDVGTAVTMMIPREAQGGRDGR